MSLVFSGGGIKGIAYIGALRQLEKLNKLKDIHHYAGSSVGALVASLVAIGYNVKEIKQLMLDIDFNKLLDDKFGIIRDIYNFIKNYGYASGEYIYKLAGKLIKAKTGNADYTLLDLYKDKQKELIITTVNLNTRSIVYLKHDNINYLNISIRQAIRMSISIPFVFQPVKYQDCYYCDGGVLNNYPIHCFDNALGLKLVQDVPEKEEINNLYEYSYAYIETFLAENDRHTLDNKNKTIFIKTDNYALSKFDLTMEEKQKLIKQGKEAVKNYFKID